MEEQYRVDEAGQLEVTSVMQVSTGGWWGQDFWTGRVARSALPLPLPAALSAVDAPCAAQMDGSQPVPVRIVYKRAPGTS